MTNPEDDDLRAIFEGFVTVTEWLLHWAAEGHIFSSGHAPVPLTRGVRSDFKMLADELAWVAKMIPIEASGDGT
jgi:hypothetical protein